MIRPLRIFVLACASIFIFGISAHAATVDLDAPTLSSPTELATSLVNLDVTAGASGAPNGFTVEWMTLAQFTALGSVWPADPADPAIQSAIFLGFPSLNTVDGTTTFLLAPFQTADIQIGDIFDETGIVSADRSEMTRGTDYVFRVKANGDIGDPTGGNSLAPASNYSATQYAHTKPPAPSDQCVFTQGYWKNHPEAWPVSALKLGNIIYTQTQLLAILGTPAAGNGLISLAHQLIAAKLNILSGAIAPSVVIGAIAAADVMIGSKIIPPIGSGFLSPATTSHLNDDLEEFNSQEGQGTIQCQHTTPSKPQSWGQLKALYR